MPDFTVIGVYGHDHGRYAETVQASDPQEAEGVAIEVCGAANGQEEGDPDLIIAAIVVGPVEIVA